MTYIRVSNHLPVQIHIDALSNLYQMVLVCVSGTGIQRNY